MTFPLVRGNGSSLRLIKRINPLTPPPKKQKRAYIKRRTIDEKLGDILIRCFKLRAYLRVA
jgi:hypothetical protein